MGEPLLLGIDVGTTRAKVGAFQLDGRPAALSAANYEHALVTDGDAAEQDPTEWWMNLQNAIRKILEHVRGESLLALCVGGQGPTLVAVDDSLEPVAPAITWMDRRAQPFAAVLSEQSGRFVPGHSFLAKAMWFQAGMPDAYNHTRWFCQAWDYIAAQLTGEVIVSTSPGVAPWDDTLLSASALNASKFPPMVDMGRQVGAVTVAAAAATGLPKGLPVIGGITDYFGGILGSGAVCHGIACDNGGTSQSFNLCWDAPLTAKGIFCVPSFDQGSWYLGGPASTTGRALEWWRHKVLGAETDDWTMVGDAGEVAAGSEGLIFLPYLAGERAPLWDSSARGVFFGLSLDHDRRHMTRSILEGVAFAVRHIMEQIESAGATVTQVHCCSGQASSDLWCQIKADVLGRPVLVPQVQDAAPLGSAIIAGVGAGVFEGFTNGAATMVHPHRTFEPDAERHATYSDLFKRYRALYPALKEIYSK